MQRLGYETIRGKSALVTGGGSGIGLRIAKELVALGCNVTILGRDEAKLQNAIEELERLGGSQVAYQVANIREKEEVYSAVQKCIAEMGSIDFLVNNAGGQFPSHAEDLSLNGWKAVIDLNLNAPFLVSKAVFDLHMQERGGSILFIVANMWNGFPYMAHSGAARAGVVNLVKTLAVEWAQYHVRVNAVAPGVIESSGMATYSEDQFNGIRQQAESSPAGRFGTEGEVAAACVFLLSEGASYITGETLKVDGGSSLKQEAQGELRTAIDFPAWK